MKIQNIIVWMSALFFPLTAESETPGFRVIGRHLVDPYGEKVVLRGVANPNIWFQKSGLPQYTEIEKTGANVVRIVWQTSGTYLVRLCFISGQKRSHASEKLLLVK